MGALLVSVEANLVVRLVLKSIGIGRAVTTHNGVRPEVDVMELKAGRVIGIVERLLIYVLVLNDQYAAIGLIIAAKSFARFKKLDERQFAEYVLVGTLTSTFTALLVSLAIKHALSGP